MNNNLHPNRPPSPALLIPGKQRLEVENRALGCGHRYGPPPERPPVLKPKSDFGKTDSFDPNGPKP